MKREPVISVVMAIYNEPIEWIEESINSILEQTFTDYEYIIILDNPNNSKVKTYVEEISKQDDRINFIVNLNNLGLTKSLNIGLKLAKGKYIARMDADDLSVPDRFKKQVDFLESNTQIIACGSWIKRFGIKNDEVKYISDNEVIYNEFTYPNPFLSPIAHPAACIRRDFLIENNIFYNEEYTVAQDYGLWNDILLKKGKLSNINDFLLLYRVSDSQITTTKRDKQLKVVKNIIIKHTIVYLENNGIKCSSEKEVFKNLIEIIKKQNSVNNDDKVLFLLYGLIRYCGFMSLKAILILIFKDKHKFISTRNKFNLVRIYFKI